MKRKWMKRVLMGVFAAVFVAAGTGCGGEIKGDASKSAEQENGEAGGSETDTRGGNPESAEKKHIKIGGTTISEVTYEAIKPHFEKLGYTTEFVMFDANPVVIEACNSKEVDMALGQHKKFIESYNENNGGELAMAKPYGYYTGIGLYSNRYTSADDFPAGARIAIMNDATNMDIALRILEASGLIKLDESVDTATIADVIENPRDIKIIDMDQAQTVTSLEDADGACVFFTHMANAEKDPKSYISRDSQMVKYPIGVIVRSENKEADWAVAFAECFKLQEVRDEIDRVYPGVFEYYEEDAQAE